MEQKDVDWQVISKASSTVPECGEMLHVGASGALVGAAVSGLRVGIMYLAKPRTFSPKIKRN